MLLRKVKALLTMFLYSDWFQHEKSELPANFSAADVGTRSRLTDYNNVRDEKVDL